jgi:lysophospholipid acyltransferase (LPLAT)-like uncharacterized protein
LDFSGSRGIHKKSGAGAITIKRVDIIMKRAYFEVMAALKKLTPLLIWLTGTLLGKTWRVKVIMPSGVDIFDPKSTPSIYCLWHSTLLVVAYVFRRTGKSVIVSSSRDGRLAADIAGRWGHSIIFGSSHKGGIAALRQSIKILKEGRSIGITPDGPKGPIEKAKGGAAQIALVSKRPLVAIRVKSDRAWRLKSWDKFLIPKPFAKLTITLSEPISPAASAYDNNNENRQAELTKLLEESFAQ